MKLNILTIMDQLQLPNHCKKDDNGVLDISGRSTMPGANELVPRSGFYRHIPRSSTGTEPQQLSQLLLRLKQVYFEAAPLHSLKSKGKRSLYHF